MSFIYNLRQLSLALESINPDDNMMADVQKCSKVTQISKKHSKPWI